LTGMLSALGYPSFTEFQATIMAGGGGRQYGASFGASGDRFSHRFRILRRVRAQGDLRRKRREEL
jgi:hypothetical protein